MSDDFPSNMTFLWLLGFFISLFLTFSYCEQRYGFIKNASHTVYFWSLKGQISVPTMQSHPSIAGKPENMILRLGPNLPPQYPPMRQPRICPRLTLLAEIKRHILESIGFMSKYLPNQESSSSDASMLGRKKVEFPLILHSCLMSGMATAENPILNPLNTVPMLRVKMACNSLMNPAFM
jgi:hypothetical protein